MITERIDAITLIPEDRLRPDAPIPRSVKIELTGRCNYRCSFCALRMRDKQPIGDMDFGLFQKITMEMRDAGVEEIGLFYLGESFVAPDLLERAIGWCKWIGIPYVFLTTNGSLAFGERVERCMALGLDSLKFSINACDDFQFKEVMGVKTALYRQALANLKTARRIRDEHGYHCRIYASSIQFDGDQAERMEALLDEHVRPFVDEHYYLPLYSMGSVATQREEELGFKPIAGNQGRIGALRDPLPCWAVFTEGHVTHEGLLSACCFDADGRFVMADLRQMTFSEAWNSEAFQRLREAHLKKNVEGTVCESCIAYS